MSQKPSYEELEQKIISLEQAVEARIKVETALVKSEKRFRELAELLPEAVFESDLTIHITFVNLHGLNMFGYTRDDFTEGINGLDMLAKEERQRARGNFIKRMKGEKSGVSEYRGVKSQIGKGTTFNVYLPSMDEKLAIPVEESKESARGSERILLVDDETAGLNAMRKTLELLGYRVTCSDSGIKALELFKKEPFAFDLIITDMTMPVMTGKELVKEITGIRPDMPTILCTGFSDQIDENEALDMGICAFILKPVIRNEIASAIRKALDTAK
ncbi:MAG: response regulator [Deltaproteobacteria bacterium]|nr:response regulator [Deltaproteobacteria bacterium]